jgi:hypothetical protein
MHFASSLGTRLAHEPTVMRGNIAMRSSPLVVIGVSLLFLPASASGLVVTETREGDANFSGQSCGSTSALNVSLPRRARRIRATPASGTLLHDVNTGMAVANVQTELCGTVTR